MDVVEEAKMTGDDLNKDSIDKSSRILIIGLVLNALGAAV